MILCERVCVCVRQGARLVCLRRVCRQAFFCVCEGMCECRVVRMQKIVGVCVCVCVEGSTGACCLGGLGVIAESMRP